MRDAATFALAAARYWGRVFPRACGELRRLRRRAATMENPALREVALAALAKRGNIEGAAAFAAFVPRRHRRAAIDALVRYQAIYNYTDTLAEQPSPDRTRNGRRLHTALLDALGGPVRSPGDYYAHHPQQDDDGFLAALVEECRSTLARLPRLAELVPVATRAAERIVCFQGLDSDGPQSALERWAHDQAPAGSGLAWWEAAGAAGSSLVVHATIAAAAGAASPEQPLAAVEDAYFPWICALHSLLDSLVDEREDAREGQLSLVGCYDSGEQARARLSWLAEAAAEAARSLPGARRHAILLAGMVAHYLSTLERSSASPRLELRRELRASLGWPLGAALSVFRVRGFVARSGRRGERERAVLVLPLLARSPRERVAAVELEDA